MSSSLPEDDLQRVVQDFGLGPYLPQSNSPGDSDDPSSERGELNGSLPGNAPTSPSPELMISYPVSSAILPGDSSRSPRSPRPADDTIVPIVPSVAQSSLPTDEKNPSSHSDYYDDTVSTRSQTYWADDGSDVYANKNKKNDINMDNYLGGAGNSWSGSVLEDVSGPYGFPSDEFNVITNDPDTSVQFSHSRRETVSSIKLATNTEMVLSLTKDFLKSFGKKDLTRRHVMAYVTKNSLPQFLVSDIIRCMKFSHSIVIKDVLDEFPVSKIVKDGRKKMASLNDNILSMIPKGDLGTRQTLFHCASEISEISDILDLIGGSHG